MWDATMIINIMYFHGLKLAQWSPVVEEVYRIFTYVKVLIPSCKNTVTNKSAALNCNIKVIFLTFLCRQIFKKNN